LLFEKDVTERKVGVERRSVRRSIEAGSEPDDTIGPGGLMETIEVGLMVRVWWPGGWWGVVTARLLRDAEA
jgi:hypothetical protein